MIDLFTSATSNGQKVSIMLEECGLDYTVHAVDLAAGEQKSEPLIGINPAGMIPAIVDHDGPGGKALKLTQSLAIVLYLADKTGLLIPAYANERAEAYRYAAIIASDTASAFSGLYLFGTYAPQPGPYPMEFFKAQVERQLGLLDQRLGESRYLAGSTYSFADILAYPHATTSASLMLPNKIAGYANLSRWAAEVGARPAVRRGLAVPG